MAGGEGSRLRPLTINRPKPMVNIVNKPVLGHIFDLLKRHGIDEAVLTVQYLASVIQDTYGAGSGVGMRISYSVEETPLGTGGSVRQVLEGLDDTFLVISGDALTDIDLSAVVRFHKERGALATLTLVRVANPLEYGVVITEPDGRIAQFLEKPSWGQVFSDTVNTGIYVLEPEALERFGPGEVFDFSKDLFPKLLSEGAPLYGCVVEGYWTDIGGIPEYVRANADVLQGRVRTQPLGREIRPGVFSDGEVEIHPEATLEGPIFLGHGTKVGAAARIIGPTVIRAYTIVEGGAYVDRAIVWRNSYIGERAEVHGAIVGRQCSLKARVVLEDGAVIGDHSVVGENARVRAGVKVWPDKQIEAGATLSTSLIWGAQGRRALFGRFGVTGLVNVDLTPDFGAALGSAWGSVLPFGSTVTMNRDQHRPSRMLKRALMAGIVSTGVHVADLSQVPIPIARHHTRRTHAAGGVHVRISPFDGRVVDIKFYDSEALDIDKATERRVETAFFREDFRRVPVEDIGRIFDAERVGEAYSTGFLNYIHHKKEIAEARFKIVLNYSNSNVALFLPQLLQALGCDVVALHANVSEAIGDRSYESFQAQMRELATITSAVGAHFGVTIDVGGEKVFFADERGRVVSDLAFLAVMARLVAEHTAGAVIGVPVYAPQALEAIAQERGGRVVRVRASAEAQMGWAHREKPALVADGLGGFIFPAFHASFDALVAIAKLLELVATRRQPMSSLVESAPEFHMARLKVDCPWEEKGRVMRMLAEEPATQATKQIDGVKHVYDGEWVLVLPDGDAPRFNIWAEARSEGKAWALAHGYAERVEKLRRSA